MDTKRLIFAWICGYGVGIFTMSNVALSAPSLPLLMCCVIFGIVIAGSGFFFDFAFKDGGWRDRIVEKKMNE